jgi:hypothetical protein
MLALRRGIFPGNPGGPSGGRPVYFGLHWRGVHSIDSPTLYAYKPPPT